MSAISGTRRKAQELSDGTLRVMIDIDPRFKAEFHKLFPNIDMPCALAPLVADFERREPEQHEKGGALARLAGIWCKDEDFQHWLAGLLQRRFVGEDDATHWVRQVCRIESRAELDNDSQAARLFQEHVRGPYMGWKEKQ